MDNVDHAVAGNIAAAPHIPAVIIAAMSAQKCGRAAVRGMECISLHGSLSSQLKV